MQTRWIQTGLALVLGTAMGASGATITVNATEDSLATNGNCTLREAILAANSDSAVDACGAGSGPDVVVVPSGVYGLTGTAGEDGGRTGDLDITDDLELVGAGTTAPLILGPYTQLSQNRPGCGGFYCGPTTRQDDRALDVDPGGAGISVRLLGVRVGSHPIFNGSTVDEGGTIRSRGTVVVTDSEISGIATTRGGGIFSLGPLRVERSKIDGAASGSGGAISALGPLEVIDSLLYFSEADSGGGISAAGPVAMVNTTIQGVVRGGGISAAGPVTLVNTTIRGNRGGGISGAGPMMLKNTTISGNAGAGISAAGTVELSNVTITQNAGGGVMADSLVLRNTIVAGNVPVDCVVTSTAGNAYNIDGDGSCGLSGTDHPGIVPLLGPLADNGGPAFTHALLPGSPAIDMGSPAAPGSGGDACERTDERGVGRPVGTRCDVGAFEGTGTPITTTTTTTTTTRNTTTTSTTTTTIPGCSLSPRPGCQAALGERSRIALKDVVADGTRNKLSWSWVGSAPVPVGDFGNPAAGTTDYTMCLYDGGGLRRQATPPAGGTCGKGPCWKATSSGFTYSDPLLDPDGIKKIVLTGGAVAGRARITVKGKGTDLGLPALPLTLPVHVQLLHDGTPSCWEGTFSTSSRNSTEIFSARSDP